MSAESKDRALAQALTDIGYPYGQGRTRRPVNDRPGLPRVALRAMRRAPDTRLLKRELECDNPYAVELLRRRGLTFYRGAIVSTTGAARARAELDAIAAETIWRDRQQLDAKAKR